VAARAHLVLLPFFRLTDRGDARKSRAHLRASRYALVVVAEGYEADRRRETSASELFKRQLEAAGLRDGDAKARHRRAV